MSTSIGYVVMMLYHIHLTRLSPGLTCGEAEGSVVELEVTRPSH